VGVFNAAQQWTALEHVELYVKLSRRQLQPNQTLDYCSAGLLGALPALKQLRSLVLNVPECGACSVAQLGQLVQLTRLQLCCTEPIIAAAEEEAGAAPANAAAVDLSALSGMSSLVELVLEGVAVQPAGDGGPYCFPSSLTRLDITDPDDKRASPACIPRCLTHLPGCPALQELYIFYSQKQHPSAHPRALVGLLAQHNTRLRKLEFDLVWGDEVQWDTQVAGLPDAAGPVEGLWHPDACLASLKGLESLAGGLWLCLAHHDDWQHLAQLTALSSIEDFRVLCSPPPLVGVTLSVVELKSCWVELGGYDLGRALLACPRLQRAFVRIEGIAPAAAVPPGSRRLTAHPTLQSLTLALYTDSGAAALSHWSALAPVLEGVSKLSLNDWPSSATTQVCGGLPDLSPCTALSELCFDCGEQVIWAEQEDFLAMLAPLVQLRRLEVDRALRLNARVALVLQHMLPQLQELTLGSCGHQLPLAAAAEHQQRQEQILGKVKQLLRPGLQLVVQ
jgi:hypothetical protein